jgi:putative pyruvate formate lyase activating enzyme
MLDKCELCPRDCKVNRLNGQLGFCKASDKVKVALVSTHYFEEPCISGEPGENQKGSGTIFFSNCNLRCMFCQNYEISHEGKGVEITTDRLAEIMIEQQDRGVNNINLVTPTIYVYQIIEAIKKAKAMGLHIPIVYNTCAYETVETIKMLEGLIDIYLPDLKYFADNISIKYSSAPHYFENATAVIKEMQRQVGENVFDENGIMQKGMIIRHLILPNHIQNTKHVLKWIKENLPEGTYVSVMAQYFPTYKAKEDESISRKINQKEYDEIEAYLEELDLENGYIQELGKHEEEYVPNFDLSNIEKE